MLQALALLRTLGFIGATAGTGALYYQYADEVDDQYLTEQERLELEKERDSRNFASSLGFLGLVIFFLYLNEKRK